MMMPDMKEHSGPKVIKKIRANKYIFTIHHIYIPYIFVVISKFSTEALFTVTIHIFTCKLLYKNL